MANQTSNNKNKDAATVSPTATKSSFLLSECTDVPIFLKKTYHMIDTCDPNVACWSEEGDTFVVKDPVKFEKQIIPQFFKHSKFSSFVRQLNFYAFRKIKYADTIRIDPKLEAETANYWRFRHEKFQRGKPELLTEIKRMNGQKQSVAPKKGQATGSSQPQAAIPVVMQQENNALKSEVSNLKQRIDAMTKNIDELTSMVQKVTLATKVPEEDAIKNNQTNKRSKVQDPVENEREILTPDESRSSSKAPQAILDSPDLSPSNANAMELDAYQLPPSIPSPLPVEDLPDVSSGTELSDEGFVDQLFTAFKTEDLLEMPTDNNDAKDNRPRPELMNRLSDALSALPRDIQELIVERLIQAITSPKDEMSMHSLTTPDHDPKHIANLQLAAATLASLLNQCGGQVQQTHSKALLIPVHA